MTDIVRKRLNNGIEVAIQPSKRSDLVSIYICVRTGSMDEEEGEFGAAHFLEHMLFKEAPGIEVGELSSRIESMGGDINAYTTFDHTTLHATVLSQHANEALSLLSRAMFFCEISDAEVELEREVIIEELQRSLDDPGAQIGRRIYEISYPNQPLSRPIIGTEESIRALTSQKLKKFHELHYAGNNAILIVCGNVDANKYLQEVENNFAKVPAGKRNMRRRPIETFPNELQVSVLRGGFQMPQLEVFFRAPDVDAADAAALNLSAYCIGNSENSPFITNLRDELGVVTQVSAGFQLASYAGLYSFSCVPVIERLDECMTAVFENIHALKHGSFPDQQALLAAKTSYQVDRLHEVESVDGKARTLLASVLTDYDIEFENVFLRRTLQTELADVKAALLRWVDFTRFGVVLQIPDEIVLTDEELHKLVLAKLITATKPDEAQKADGLSIDPPKPRIYSKPLRENIRLVGRTVAEAELLDIVICKEGGLRFDPKDQIGLHHAVGSLVGFASNKRTASEVIQFIEDCGAVIEGFSGKDSFGLRMQCRRSDADKMLDLLFELMFQAEIPLDRFESYARNVKQTIESESDNPSVVASRKMQELIFLDHPYRNALYGDLNMINKLTHEQVDKFARETYLTGKWTIAAVSSLPEAELASLVETRISKWKPKSASKSSPLKPTPSKAKIENISLQRKQVHVIFARPGTSWQSADRVPLDIIGSYIGGSGGELFMEIRERQGLVYSIGPSVNHGVDAGMFAIHFACQPEKADKAKKLVLESLHRMAMGEIEDEEIERARNYVLGAHESDLQRGESQAMSLALMTVYELGPTELDAYKAKVQDTTVDDIRRCAAKYLHKEGWFIVSAGPS
jgi:zinc protease